MSSENKIANRSAPKPTRTLASRTPHTPSLHHTTPTCSEAHVVLTGRQPATRQKTGASNEPLFTLSTLAHSLYFARDRNERVESAFCPALYLITAAAVPVRSRTREDCAQAQIRTLLVYCSLFHHGRATWSAVVAVLRVGMLVCIGGMGACCCKPRGDIMSKQWRGSLVCSRTGRACMCVYASWSVPTKIGYFT